MVLRREEIANADAVLDHGPGQLGVASLNLAQAALPS